jgi:hypothetical protein
MDEPNELDPLFVSDVGLHERFSGHVCCTRGFVALLAEDKKCPVSYPAGRQRR